ncbi:hypothetical protein DTL42_19655 [Bremerella cremea]|uniref:Carbohydrate binding module family 25 domain-containing protein n=2 Tax=Bremerella cremea TaxID=1031537 RepID=A0A368KLG0_9BACT|nr:hypothetical protein DTL42_19655 [Bremerella cremea]
MRHDAIAFSSADPQPGEPVTIMYKGSLANAETLYIHCGFNGWNQVSDPQLQVEDSGGNLEYFIETPLTKIEASHFEITIQLSREACVWHFVFFSENGLGRTWDNNGSDDYRAAVGRLYLGPYLPWNSNTQPHSGVVVNCITHVPMIFRLKYGKDPTLGKTVTGAFATHHRLELNDLQTVTGYFERLFRDEEPLTPVHRFKTAKEEVSVLSFMLVRDMQDSGDNRRWGDTAIEIAEAHSDVDFLILVGDLTWNDTPGHWWTFFDMGREVLTTKVAMPIIGNHDTPWTGSHWDAKTFLNNFAFLFSSTSLTFSSFRFGPVRFLEFDTEVPDEFSDANGKQFQWAQAELGDIASDPEGEWVFALMHIAPCNAGRRHRHTRGRFHHITRLFNRVVDWVFFGHERLYQRFHPLQYNATFTPSEAYGSGADDGVGYLIVPPAGNLPESHVVASEFDVSCCRKRLVYPAIDEGSSSVASEIGFVTADIDGRTIRLRTSVMGTLEMPVAS